MILRHSPPVVALALVTGLFAAAPFAADEAIDDQARIEEQLRRLREEIAKYQQMLDSTKDERSTIEKDLETNEKKIGDLIQEIKKIESELDETGENIEQLQDEQERLDQKRIGQQSLLIKQIRAAYEIGREGAIKVLLNQEDPGLLSRMSRYYDYFNHARVVQIERYQQTIVALGEVEVSLAAERVRLADQREQLAGQRTALEATRAARQATLVALRQTIRTRTDELNKLQADRQRLELLLDSINSEIIDIPTPFDTVSFAALKGKMQLPVPGVVKARFNRRARSGQLHQNGLFIAADEGTAVHAVHYGRVVFSDWLRGFGLLMIINHGEGYMSLYGHNQALLFETGDWVVAGETIAHVGDSGGLAETGLYFEIRQDGDPQNPESWCQARA